jgi:ubiquinone/menaquinone biosynthesis C-methylase UbiE
MTFHTDSSWKFYGRKAPYFGVIGLEEYLNDNLDQEKLDGFFSSGEAEVRELFDLIHSKIDPEFRPVSILDFGCGPGRMVIPFSKYAGEVVGMDISPEVLSMAGRNCRDRNVLNVGFLLSDDDLSRISERKFDLVHSFIVLQHLDVKRGERILKRLIDKINDNGVGVIHLTYHDNYPGRNLVNFFRFNIPFIARILRMFRKDPIKSKLPNRPQMQMNNYNLNSVFASLQQAGIHEVISEFTNHHDYWGVMLCFARNRRL